jgi:diacylglycerol O-acyltransferase / wax synthase
MHQLTGQDAMFMYMDKPGAAAHGTLVYLYDQTTAPKGLVRFKDILHHVEANLPLAPFFRKKLLRVPLELDFPYLVDDEAFDINYHVRHIALPKPGDWRQFCIQAARLTARPLDMARPLWEMYVIEGLDKVEGMPKGSFAILTKLHHCVVDGTALSELTWKLHSPSPEVVRQRIRKWTPEKPPEMFALLKKATVNAAMDSIRTGKALATIGPKLAGLASKLAGTAMSGKHKVPATRFNADIGTQRVFDGVRFEFEDIRKIKGAVPGATVNDAVAALVGGALRTYLKSKKERVDPSLVAVMPINARTEATERKTQGNTIALMTATLRTDIADPLERLAAIHEGTSRSKEISNAIGARDLANLTKHTPAPTMMLATKLLLGASFMADARLPFYNCCISNVPGPQQPFYLLGAKLLCLTVVAPLTNGLTMFFAVSSYNGGLFVTLTSTPEIVPDPSFMAACLRGSMDEFKAAALKRVAPKSKAKRKSARN